jgi:hypothetical protein
MSYPDREVQYEHAIAVNNVRRGPLRFEEGVATDTDVPNDFGRGAYGDTAGDGRGRTFTNWKGADETMRERAHVGSATWIEAPTMLNDFVIGASIGQGPPQFEMELGSEQRLIRLNPAMVND